MKSLQQYIYESVSTQIDIKSRNTVDLIKEAAKFGTRKVEVKFVPPYNEKEHGNLPTAVKNKISKVGKTEIFDVVDEATEIIDLIKNPKDVISIKFVK